MDLRWCQLVESAISQALPGANDRRRMLERERLLGNEFYKLARVQFLAGASDRVVLRLLAGGMLDMAE